MQKPDSPAKCDAVPGWEHFPHVADIGVRGFGKNVAQAFEQAALAITAVITDPSTVRPLNPVEIHCEAPDIELLLVDWLNAVVYEMATRRMLFSEFAVRIDGPRLQAQIRGEPIDAAMHCPAAEVKGATMSELRVDRAADGRWSAQCVVDV